MAAMKTSSTPARKPGSAKAGSTAAGQIQPNASVEAAPAIDPETTSVSPADPVEDIVGVSPVVEAFSTKIAELPQRISAAVTDINKTQTEVMTHMEKAMKSAEEMVSFGQGNVEAILKAGQIWAAGVQDLSKHFAVTAQASMDETMATVKALSSVKSLKEAVDLQTSLAKTAMEKMVAETGKITDATVKLAEQTMAPITARVTLATEKFGRAV